MNNEYEKIDFFIPLHRYHFMVRTVVEAIYKFYSPRTIYIITPSRFSKTIINASKNSTGGQSLRYADRPLNEYGYWEGAPSGYGQSPRNQYN